MTVLTAGTDRVISGSPDGHVRFWDISGFKPLQTVSVSGSVLAVDVWGHYLAIGSTVIQMVDMSSRELRRIKFFEENESIPVPDTVHVHLSGREIQLMCYPLADLHTAFSLCCICW